MIRKLRNRRVAFRVSQDECHALLEARRRAGASSLSDFIRAEVLERLGEQESADHVTRRRASVERQTALYGIPIQ